MSEVKLTGSADLEEIYQALKRISEHSGRAMTEMSQLGKSTQATLEKTAKKTETGIKNSGGLMRRVASQLYSDFKGLLALQSGLAGLKLSSQFAGSLKESLKLNDTVRRLGTSFGVARNDFGKFQAQLARGMGDIGASSEATANALEGLAGSGVKGIESAKNLAKGAVTLAGIGGEKGNEKGIATGLTTAIQAQGKDVNDVGAQKALIGEVTAAVTATGKSASEILNTMNDIFASMPQELRKTIGPKAMAQMATMAATAGPGATKALQEYLSKTAEQRMGMEAQGFNVFKNGQIDMKALQGFIKNTEARGISPRASLQSAGFSEEAAEGLVRLGEKAQLVQENLDKLGSATRDNEQAFRDTMGLLDSFKGSINTVKGWLESAFQGVSQKLTGVLSGQVGHAGSAAVVAGGGLAAAALTGVGIRKVSEMLLGKTAGGMVGGLYKGAAAQALTGKDVQPVYVVNANDIGGGEGGTATKGLLGGAAGQALGKAGAVAAAGAAGYALGAYVVNPTLDKYTTDKNENGFEGNIVERFFDKLNDLTNGGLRAGEKTIKIQVDTKTPNLNTRTEPGRGPSN